MYIGNDLQIAHPSYKIIDDISSGFNGSATSFALQVSGATPVPFPISTQQVMISVNGVVQEPDPNGSAGFKLLGSNIVFSSAPANGHAFFGVINAGADYVTAGSEFPDGSATAPSFTFQDDQDTGWFRSGSGAVGFSANGVNTIGFDGNGLTVTGDATFTGDSSKNLFWDKSDGQLEFADNAKAVFGNGSDLKIWHDGTNSVITNATGDLYINNNADTIIKPANDCFIKPQDGENGISVIGNGAVELYHNNSKKFETASTGVYIRASGGSGFWIDNQDNAGKDIEFVANANKLKFNDDVKANFGTGDDLQIYHDGSHSYINESGTGHLKIRSDDAIKFQKTDGSWIAVFNADASTDLYYDNVKKLETSSSGITVTDSNASVNIKFENNSGTAGYVYSDGTNTGFLDSQTHWLVKGVKDGAVELYYDNVKIFETYSWGVDITGTVEADQYNLQDSDGTTQQIRIGASGDLRLYHTGSDSVINQNSQHDLEILHGAETMAKFVPDGAVELYHDNVKTFETTATGINVTGQINVNGAALSTAPEITATAHGTVTAEKAVIVRSDGKVETVANVPASNGSFTNMNPFNNQGKLTRIASNNNGQYVLLEDTNVSNGLNATVLTVSGTTVTKNSATVISTDCSQQSSDDNFDITYDSTANKFVVVYIQNSSRNVIAKTLTISGTGTSASLSQGTELTIGSSVSEFCRCGYDPDADKTALIADVGNDAFAWALTVSGTNVSSSSAVQFDEGKTPFQQPNMCYDNKNKKFQILWRQSSSGSVRPQTLTWDASNARYNGYSGTPPILWSNGYEGPISIAHIKDTDGYVCHYKRSNNIMYARLITCNSTGSTITAGSETQTHASYAYRSGDMKHDSLNEKMMLISRGTDGFIDYKVLSYNVTNRTLSVDSTTILANSSTNPNSNTFVAEGINAAFDTTNNIFLCSFAKNQSGSYSTNQVMALQRPSTTLDATKFIGFASSTVTDGNTATVKVASNTSTQSSLTPAIKYYVQGDGTVGATASNPSVEAGIALSSTKLLIKG